MSNISLLNTLQKPQKASPLPARVKANAVPVETEFLTEWCASHGIQLHRCRKFFCPSACHLSSTTFLPHPPQAHQRRLSIKLLHSHNVKQKRVRCEILRPCFTEIKPAFSNSERRRKSFCGAQTPVQFGNSSNERLNSRKLRITGYLWRRSRRTSATNVSPTARCPAF